MSPSVVAHFFTVHKHEQPKKKKHLYRKCTRTGFSLSFTHSLYSTLYSLLYYTIPSYTYAYVEGINQLFQTAQQTQWKMIWPFHIHMNARAHNLNYSIIIYFIKKQRTNKW